MTGVIEATGLTKWYGRRRGIVDVDFAVASGEVFGFLGPNGAGKTTTIRLLLGLLRPTSGRVSLFGLDAWTAAPEIHRRLAYLGSDPGYLGELTAAEQLDYLAALRGLTRGCWRSLAERLDLDPGTQIRKLSRGNRNKVGVVAVFMGQEPLLVMDEPTSALDPLMQREFLGLVADARAAGRTVFLSSHNLTEVERACDRVGIVRDGRLVDISTVAELLGQHWRSVNLVVDGDGRLDASLFDLPNVRLVATSGRDCHLMIRGDMNPFLRRLASLEVRDVAITTPDIEDVFLGYYNQRGTPDDSPPGSSPARAVDR